MLDLFLDTERTARALGKWRGPMMMLCGLGLFLVAFFVAKIQALVLSFSSLKIEAPQALFYVSMGIFGLGCAAIFYGLWVYYKDTMYQSWRIESNDYTRW